MARTVKPSLVVTATLPYLRFARTATEDTVDDVKSSLVDHISRLNFSETITFHVDSISPSFQVSTEHTMQFTNICVKIEHYDTTKVHMDAMLPLCCRMKDGFGEFITLNSHLGNIRTSAALTCSSVRAARSTDDIQKLISHAFLPQSIRSICVHMMIATKNLGHPIIITGSQTVEILKDNPKWQGTTRILDEEIGRRQCLHITSFDRDWLQSMALPANPSQCILNLYRNGLVNIFLSFSPGLPFAVGMERQYTDFLDGIICEVQKYT